MHSLPSICHETYCVKREGSEIFLVSKLLRGPLQSAAEVKYALTFPLTLSLCLSFLLLLNLKTHHHHHLITLELPHSNYPI